MRVFLLKFLMKKYFFIVLAINKKRYLVNNQYLRDKDGNSDISDDDLPQAVVEGEVEELLELAACEPGLLEAVLDEGTLVVHVENDVVLFQLVVQVEYSQQFLHQRLSFHVVLGLVFHVLNCVFESVVELCFQLVQFYFNLGYLPV